MKFRIGRATSRDAHVAGKFWLFWRHRSTRRSPRRKSHGSANWLRLPQVPPLLGRPARKSCFGLIDWTGVLAGWLRRWASRPYLLFGSLFVRLGGQQGQDLPKLS